MAKKIKRMAGGGKFATYENLTPEEKRLVDKQRAEEEKEYQTQRDKEVRADRVNRLFRGLGRAFNLGAKTPGESEDTYVRPKKRTEYSGTTYYPTSGPGETLDFSGKAKNYAKGGSVKSSASKRADGCAQRGKTRGKMR